MTRHEAELILNEANRHMGAARAAASAAGSLWAKAYNAYTRVAQGFNASDETGREAIADLKMVKKKLSDV